MSKINKLKTFNNVMLFGVFLVAYILLFLYALVFRDVSPLDLFSPDRDFIRSVNLIPFHTIYNYLCGTACVSSVIVATNIFGNILIFIPLGIYLQLFMRDKRVWTNALVVLCVAIVVELLQFVFGLGAADIDDVLLNCVGGLAGIFLYRGLCSLLKDEERARLAIVIAGLVVIIVPITIVSMLGLRFKLV